MTATERAGVMVPTPPPPKVQPRHLERVAAVYVRQSTARQVLENRESTALQYGLRSRAVQWGWPPERVLVIDEDLGCSGATRGDSTDEVCPKQPQHFDERQRMRGHPLPEQVELR